MNTDRVTRSRARTQAAGETPSLSALPDQKTAGTARTTRRRAAAAATAAPSGDSEAVVQPAVLFDATDAVEQDGAAPGPASPAAAAAPRADEPPATPVPSVPPSPAPPVPGATPTGLGLSTLQPLSPLPAAVLPASTPVATPLAGVAANSSQVASALHAAAQALGGLPAPAQAVQQPDLLFKGFGSPLKQAADSPDVTPAPIGGAMAPAPAAAMPGPGPECYEQELTLEEMMGTPFPSAGTDTPGDSTPTLLGRAPAAAPVASAAPAVRTVQKAHPLTPARQVVLEEEEQDYIMQVDDAKGATDEVVQQQLVTAESADEGVAPAPSPEEAPPAKPRLASKVVVPSPGDFDPRSLRQLRRDVADRLAAKSAVGADLEEEEEDGGGEGLIGTSAAGEALADELGALSLGVHGPLRGLPTPAGAHIRFDDDGEVAGVSPQRQRTFLRGLPQPQGSHIRFE